MKWKNLYYSSTVVLRGARDTMEAAMCLQLLCSSNYFSRNQKGFWWSTEIGKESIEFLPATT